MNAKRFYKIAFAFKRDNDSIEFAKWLKDGTNRQGGFYDLTEICKRLEVLLIREDKFWILLSGNVSIDDLGESWIFITFDNILVNDKEAKLIDDLIDALYTRAAGCKISSLSVEHFYKFK